MNKGIIYLVQPTEYLLTNIYKIGCSKQTNLSRCQNGYRKGTRYISIAECTYPLLLEKNIINQFKIKFKLFIGNEYFEGDENEMYTEFINKINEHKIQVDKRNEYKLQVEDVNEYKLQVEDVNEHKLQVENVNEHKLQVENVNEHMIQVEDVNEHMIQVENVNEHMIQVENVNEINEHKNNNDKLKIPYNVKKNKLKCEKCLKIFNVKSTYDRHIKRKTPCNVKNIFTCIKCLKTFDYKSEYERHINKKISCNNKNKFTCYKCMKIFTKKSTYDKHKNKKNHVT